MESRQKENNKIAVKIFCAVFWLAVWQIGAMAYGRSFILPSPVTTLITMGQLFGKQKFWVSCAVTFLRVTAGLVLSAGMGFACAYGAWKSSTVKELLAIPVAAVKSVPVMSVILFALLWLKSAAVPVFVCFLMCFPVMYTNILQGFNNVPEEYRELAAVYKLSAGKYFTDIMVPASMGYIKAGFNLCAGLSWKSCVAAEVLSNPKISMGYNLISAKMYLQGEQLFAWTAAIVILSIIFEKLLKLILNGRN